MADEQVAEAGAESTPTPTDEGEGLIVALAPAGVAIARRLGRAGVTGVLALAAMDAGGVAAAAGVPPERAEAILAAAREAAADLPAFRLSVRAGSGAVALPAGQPDALANPTRPDGAAPDEGQVRARLALLIGRRGPLRSVAVCFGCGVIQNHPDPELGRPPGPGESPRHGLRHTYKYCGCDPRVVGGLRAPHSPRGLARRVAENPENGDVFALYEGPR